MSDLNLRMVAQAPVPTPRPTLVPEERVVSGVRTIHLKSATSERQTVYLYFNNNKLFKVVSESIGERTSKDKYLPKEKQLIQENWNETTKKYESSDMTFDTKIEFVLDLKDALKQIEKGGQRDAFLEAALENAINEIEAIKW